MTTEQLALPGVETKPSRRSSFDGLGLRATLDQLVAEMAEVYRASTAPWVVGYSGGKDSTAVLSLVWAMLASLSPDQRTRPVHVISTDTMVENPVVVAWVNRSLDAMRAAAEAQGLPVTPHRLRPAIKDTFWVNLIGRGYPAPRHKFRWCTDRLKIQPSNTFITNLTQQGQVILVLGTRKAESAARARTMAKHEQGRVQDRLSPNAGLPGSLVYSPIEDWANDDVWIYLMQRPNPWGFNNRDLLGMYQGASEGGECPLVVDTSTPSCGSSRFGCWVCTMVEQDKSMAAMVTNDEEKVWMRPLLALRDELDIEDDRHLRDHRRMNGTVQLHKKRLIHGPYTPAARAMWLRRVLEVQAEVRRGAPEEMREIELISLDEMDEIRRIWVTEKNEVEDVLPDLYHEVTGQPYPGRAFGDAMFDADTLALLRQACGGDEARYLLLRDLLSVTHRHTLTERRKGLHADIGKVLRRHSNADPEQAAKTAASKLPAEETDPQGSLFGEAP